jgi:NitT/TauT family transport system substrate-binding protein
MNHSSRLGKSIATIFCTSFLFACLTGCGAIANPLASTATPSLVTIKVGSLPYISMGAMFIAQDKGYFAEQQLNVEFTFFENGSTMVPAFIRGDVDIAGDGTVISTFNAMASTPDVKAVADRGYVDANGCAYVAMLAKPEWIKQHPNPTADDIRGLRTAIEPKGFQGFMYEQYLATLGLTLNDLTINNITTASMLAAVENGSLDMVTASEPWVTRTLDTGKMVVWKNYKDVVPNMQFGFLMYNKNLVRDHRDVGERFMIGYLKGIRQYNLGKTDENIAILAKYTKQDPALIKRTCWPGMRNDGSMDFKTILQFQNWAMGKKLLDKVISESDLLDDGFLQKANTALGAAAS